MNNIIITCQPIVMSGKCAWRIDNTPGNRIMIMFTCIYHMWTRCHMPASLNMTMIRGWRLVEARYSRCSKCKPEGSMA